MPAASDLLRDKLSQLLTADPPPLLPDALLHRLLRRTSSDPDRFGSLHAALCASDPRLKLDDRGLPANLLFLPLLAAASRARPAGPGGGKDPSAAPRSAALRLLAERLAGMADMAKPRSVAGLLEELGYGATATEATVRELLQQVDADGCAPDALYAGHIARMQTAPHL